MGQATLKKYDEYARDLYSKALAILKSEKCDESDVIAGGILLIVGLEKLVKWVIHSKNPLMTLLKPPRFEDLLKYQKGSDFRGSSTVSFEEALNRLIALYPEMKPHHSDIKAIIKYRNMLMHNFGFIDIGNLERRIQIKVADFTEDLFKHCTGSTPATVLGEESWNILRSNREIYKNVESLALNNRIVFLRKRLKQGESLGCTELLLSPCSPEVSDVLCPICDQEEARVVFEVDSDADVYDGQLYGTEPTIIYLGMDCKCGFSLDDEEEITLLIEENEIIEEQVEQGFSDELSRLWSKMM